MSEESVTKENQNGFNAILTTDDDEGGLRVCLGSQGDKKYDGMGGAKHGQW